MIGLAKKTSCTPEQALFRLAQDIGITPLAGSQNEQHMKDGVRAEDLPALDVMFSDQLLRYLR